MRGIRLIQSVYNKALRQLPAPLPPLQQELRDWQGPMVEGSRENKGYNLLCYLTRAPITTGTSLDLPHVFQLPLVLLDLFMLLHSDVVWLTSGSLATLGPVC